MRRLLGILVVAATAAAVLVSTPLAASAAERPTFIVVLRDDVRDPAAVAREHRREHGGELIFVYTAALKGYAGSFTEAAMREIATDSRVEFVERDQQVVASGSQTNPTWGLDRIDDRRGLDGSFDYTNTGAGVQAYVIDSGIRLDHVEFGGRAVAGFDAFADGAEDCNGHGTHVAGTIGGSNYGVAKGVSLVDVRVLDCGGSGTWSGVIAGIDWVTANHVKPAVANMSLGGGASTAVDTAVKNSIAAGVTYAIAAGNGNMGGVAQDACKYSPARVPEAITVSAATPTDAKASWANHGKCVDWFAPGTGVVSASHQSSTDSTTKSGTSMATPHTAGVAALYLETAASASPVAVRDALFSATTKGIVSSAKTSNNHLLFTAY